MKKPIVPALFIGALLSWAGPVSAQVDIEPDSSYTAYEPECGGYAPMAFFHFMTDVDGLRLRQLPSLDAPVKAVLPKNTRLIWRGNDSDEEFSVTFSDGIPRKGVWCFVSVWKGEGLDGWVFTGALTLTYAMVDAEFEGGLEALNDAFFDVKQLDSLEYAHRLSKAQKILKKPGSGVLLISPDGLYGVRQLAAKDRMTGLEFVIFQKDGSQRKITVEDLYGGSAKTIAWAKEPGRILIKWSDKVDGIVYYDFAMPLPVRPY